MASLGNDDQVLVPMKFVWDHGGKDVHLCLADLGGTFAPITMKKNETGRLHEVKLELSPGRYEYT